MKLRHRPFKPGTFGRLPLEIVLMILWRLDLGDLARVELYSSYFRWVALEGWRKRAEVRKKVENDRLKIMKKDLEELEKGNVTQRVQVEKDQQMDIQQMVEAKNRLSNSVEEELKETKKYIFHLEKVLKMEEYFQAENW